MKPLLPLLFLLSLPLAHAQDEATQEPAESAESVPLAPWQQDFLNLPEAKRVDFARHLNEARELFQQKRIFETMDKLHEARAIFADSPDVENLLGACQVEFRNFDDATAHFERSLELAPGNASVLFNIGEVAFVTKQWEKSEKILGEVLALMPEGNSAQLQMVRLVEFKLLLTKLKLGKMDEAREMAAKYDYFDDSPFHYYAKAAIAYLEDDTLTAESEIARAGRIFRNPAILAPWQDTLMEFGYIKSFFGGDIDEAGE